MLRTSDLDYDLPESAIAITPAEPRDAARLMVISRSDPARLDHLHIRDLPGLLAPDDLIVFNTTRVLRARLQGHRADTGGLVEGLYLQDAPAFEPGIRPGLRWMVLLRGRRVREQCTITLQRADASPAGVRLIAEHRVQDEPGAWIVHVESDQWAPTSPPSSAAVLESIGTTPLPPYILKARRHQHLDIADTDDRSRYQTVYAASSGASVAAPTAGLHFTPALLESLRTRGIRRADVTLHVGTGTFRPVETELVEQHPMHQEWCSMPEATRAAIAAARTRAPDRQVFEGDRGRPPSRARVIAVGTTSARTIESYARAVDDAATAGPRVSPELPPSIATRLLITPGYTWRWTDGLLTNFHLPRSTLLAMVAALLPEGAPRLLNLYKTALERGYRFYSYGDAMLVLP